MNDQRHYFVYLQPKFIESINRLEPLIKKPDNFIGCNSIKELPHYLEMKVPYSDTSSDEPGLLELLIPHSQILYILSTSEKDLNRIPGFHSRGE